MYIDHLRNLATTLRELILKTAGFEINDAITRQLVVDEITNYLNAQSIKINRIICDESNNTIETILSHELVVSVGIYELHDGRWREVHIDFVVGPDDFGGNFVIEPENSNS